jgi:hypothetical protein
VKQGQMIQMMARLVGVVFVAVGVLGFVPGITTNYDDLGFAGADSDAELLGLFQVSVLHNLIHIGFGLIGIALARSWEGARTFLLVGAVTYLALFVYGLVVGPESDANFVPLNWADDAFHLALGLFMLAAWGMNKDDRDKLSVGGT